MSTSTPTNQIQACPSWLQAMKYLQEYTSKVETTLTDKIFSVLNDQSMSETYKLKWLTKICKDIPIPCGYWDVNTPFNMAREWDMVAHEHLKYSNVYIKVQDKPYRFQLVYGIIAENIFSDQNSIPQTTFWVNIKRIRVKPVPKSKLVGSYKIQSPRSSSVMV